MLEMMTKDYFSSSSSPLTAAYSLLQLNIIILHDLQENWYCLKHLIFELHIKVDGIISCLKLKLAPSFFNLLAVHRTYMRLEYFEKMFEFRKDQIIYFFNFRSPARYKYFVFIQQVPYMEKVNFLKIRKFDNFNFSCCFGLPLCKNRSSTPDYNYNTNLLF